MKDERYSFKDTLKENAGLSVYNTGYERCDSTHSWGPALRDHYLIHYVSAGHGSFTSNRQTYSLQTGDLFFVAPGQLVSYRADPLDPWEYCWVGFNGTDARRLVTMAGFSAQRPVLHTRDAELRSRLLRIAEVSGNTAVSDAEMVGCLYLFLARLIQLNDQRAVSDPHQEYVANALRFMQYNYANDIGVNDIAQYVGISSTSAAAASRRSVVLRGCGVAGRTLASPAGEIYRGVCGENGSFIRSGSFSPESRGLSSGCVA